MFIRKWGTTGTGDSQFKHPEGIAVDAVGNVYVVDPNNNRIQKFNPTGTFLAKWGIGNLYTSGVAVIASGLPRMIALDAAGNVYVLESDGKHSSVQKFDAAGAFLAMLVTGNMDYGAQDGKLYAPGGITLDAAGNIYVSDSSLNLIQKFSPTGAFLSKWGTQGAGDGQLKYPSQIAVDAAGNMYVLDQGNRRIEKFRTDGTFLTKWSTLGTGDGQFAAYSGIAVDAVGNVYVCDSDRGPIAQAKKLQYCSIQKFSPTGVSLARWGTYGTADGEFGEQVVGIAVDSAGNVYVADTYNDRVQLFKQ